MVQMIPVSSQGRTMRRPQHRFAVRVQPWQVQPVCIAPVLPGETLRNLLLQARVVTDPIRNPLIGWWCEYYAFYIKHRDLADRDDFTGMMLDPGKDMSSHLAGAVSLPLYTFDGGFRWTEYCLDRVIEEFFRDEGDEASHEIASVPAASISQESWLDSVQLGSSWQPTDINVDENTDGTITASEVSGALQQWQHLRALGLTDQTYEDYLRSFGVSIPKAEESHRPELLRYVRDWTYPSNTVDPSTGDPSSACSWAVSERADKDRFFKEPGFVFVVQVVRPKVYLSGQTGSATGLLADALAWLPAVLSDEPYTSLRKVLTGEGPLPGVTDAAGYWVDVKDLFLYGDQLVNFALTDTAAGLVALPTAGLEKRYATAADASALFAGESGGVITSDGVVSLSIAGTQIDTTARV